MWVIKHQSELSAAELYGILKLRNAVYIVELQRPVADTDGEDLTGDTYHLMNIDESAEAASYTPVVAYLRMHWDKKTNEVLIRRVVVAKERRGQGLASTMMAEAIEWCEQQHVVQINVPARIHLQGLYESLGFSVVGEKYYIEQVAVWHVNMVRRLK